MLAQLVDRGAKALGVVLPEEAPGAFAAYYDLLTRRNREFNLTAIQGEAETVSLHFLDSLSLLPLWDFRGKRVVDVGTGAGFPGLALKLGEPSMDLTLVDSTEKKVAFLKEVCAALPLEARCLHARAEELGREETGRERFDVAVSRAVARLPLLAELCLPLVTVGGVFLAMKGAALEEELEEAENAIRLLGGRVARTVRVTVPGLQALRQVAVIEKIAPTPPKYPRRFAKIQKSPL